MCRWKSPGGLAAARVWAVGWSAAWLGARGSSIRRRTKSSWLSAFVPGGPCRVPRRGEGQGSGGWCLRGCLIGLTQALLPAAWSCSLPRGCGRRQELGQGDLGFAAGNGAAASCTCVAPVPNLSWGKDRLEQLSKALGFSLGTQTKPRGAGSWNPEPGLAGSQARAESIGISVPALLPLPVNCCMKHGKLHF